MALEPASPVSFQDAGFVFVVIGLIIAICRTLFGKKDGSNSGPTVEVRCGSSDDGGGDSDGGD